MAAVFFHPSPGRDVFRGGLVVNTAVRIPFLDALVGTNGFSVINDVSIQNADTIQYFLTFDDLVSYFYFGKGLGAINISGTMFTDCDGHVPGIDIFYGQISRFRGTPVDVSFGSAIFTGVISSFTTTAVAETQLIEFQIVLSIIDHSLASPVFVPLC